MLGQAATGRHCSEQTKGGGTLHTINLWSLLPQNIVMAINLDGLSKGLNDFTEVKSLSGYGTSMFSDRISTAGRVVWKGEGGTTTTCAAAAAAAFMSLLCGIPGTFDWPLCDGRCWARETFFGQTQEASSYT